MTSEVMRQLCDQILSLGAVDTAVIGVETVTFNPDFRKVCESNACGLYGRSWMCPPLLGEAESLIAKAKTFDALLVYRTVGELEDSFDIEGMLDAGRRHNDLAQAIQRLVREKGETDVLHLGAGGCRRCPVCAKMEARRCRHPEEALASLEGYCIDVSRLAASCGMQYHSGPGTVTYFGALLVRW